MGRDGVMCELFNSSLALCFYVHVLLVGQKVEFLRLQVTMLFGVFRIDVGYGPTGDSIALLGDFEAHVDDDSA